MSDQDAPYLRIRVCCKTLKITKLEAAAGQAGKHCLTMFGMERTKTTGLHREHVVSIQTLSITAYITCLLVAEYGQVCSVAASCVSCLGFSGQSWSRNV